MLIYVEGKNFLGRTFVLTCDAGDTIGRLKALLLHILHDLGRSDHFFRLRFGDFYLREPLTLKDYNISEMSVLQMVPISFGRHARPETTAGVPRPFTTLTRHKPHTLTNEQGPTHPLSSVGAHTLSALRKEVTIFKRRQHLLQALKAMVWVLLVSVIVSFATVYWWSGFWIGLTVVVSLYLMPSYVHVGGTMGRMTKRDKWLIAVYSVVFVIVATVNLVMFVYLLVAVVIKRDCSSFPDPASLLGCSHRLWLSLALYPLQALLFLTGTLTAILLLANFTFEAGQLVEPTLIRVKEVKELIQIAEVGSSMKDRRQVAFELSNIALLGGKNKEQIAADGGLQLLTSMMSGDDEVTQEYASEALAEMLSFPADQAPTNPTTIQAEFVSQGGVATLCALLHSTNVFIVEKAALSLSYLSSTCLGNRMAVTQERGLDDLQRIFTKSHTKVQLLVGQILMNFAMCDESRPFLLDHRGLVDVMVEAVGMNQLREAVKTSALKALLELGRADNRVILNRPGLIEGLLDIQSLGGKEIHHSCLELLLTFAQDSEGLKQLLVHSDLLSSLQDLVHSVTSDRYLALLMLQVVLVMLKVHRHRARLISIGVRDLLEELQNKLDAVTAQDDELINLLAECWLQFNNN